MPGFTLRSLVLKLPFLRSGRTGEAGAECESQETSAAHSVYDARSRHVPGLEEVV